ncbi:NRT2.5 [Symbiodinium microadriaticum]|nr:NRT2.5 [Symbiodinium microadriaticum]
MREALLAGLPPGAAAISFASSIAGEQALTSLCGLVFACKDAPEAVFPALSMQEMALAVLRRGVRPWRGEKMPDALEEARQLWGADRVEEVLSCWLAQFHSLFGPPLAELAEDWEAAATPHRLPL